MLISSDRQFILHRAIPVTSVRDRRTGLASESCIFIKLHDKNSGAVREFHPGAPLFFLFLSSFFIRFYPAVLFYLYPAFFIFSIHSLPCALCTGKPSHVPAPHMLSMSLRTGFPREILRQSCRLPRWNRPLRQEGPADGSGLFPR